MKTRQTLYFDINNIIFIFIFKYYAFSVTDIYISPINLCVINDFNTIINDTHFDTNDNDKIINLK